MTGRELTAGSRPPGAAHGVPEVKGGRNVDHVCIALSPFDDDGLDPFGNQLELKGPVVYPDGRAELQA